MTTGARSATGACRARVCVAMLAAVMLIAACGSRVSTATTVTVEPTVPTASVAPASGAPATTVSATPAASAAPDASGTVWLCAPGLADDPCTSDLTATAIAANGTTTREAATPATDPPIDCFYVYPTVSTELSVNADLQIRTEERSVAVAQASRFSQVCRVFAPMYPQLTLLAIARPRTITAQNLLTAYQGVADAFSDYLANDNHGRGFVLIGHSQGASMLISLLQHVVDPDPALRRQLVSALLMGGNPTVPAGATTGGDFKNIPTCAAATQTGCVLAYSSFDQPPPSNALFGRPGAGFSALRTQSSAASLQVICVNPAAVSGGIGTLQPYLPTQRLLDALGGSLGILGVSVDTPWITFPDEYTAQCQSADGANWLQVNDARGPTDQRPVVSQTLGPTWGLHLVDVNIALGNLVDVVGQESGAFQP